jgi:ElaB/YqjD/DUF883 family membrane-anchored ribosome-binding protein
LPTCGNGLHFYPPEGGACLCERAYQKDLARQLDAALAERDALRKNVETLLRESNDAEAVRDAALVRAETAGRSGDVAAVVLERLGLRVTTAEARVQALEAERDSLLRDVENGYKVFQQEQTRAGQAEADLAALRQRIQERIERWRHAADWHERQHPRLIDQDGMYEVYEHLRMLADETEAVLTSSPDPAPLTDESS